MKGILTLATLAAFLVLPQVPSAAQLATPLSSSDRYADSGNHGYNVSAVTTTVVRLDNRDGSTLLNPSPLGDDNTTTVNFGFNFDFFGTTYTEGLLSSNGWLSLGPGTQINGASSNGGSMAHPEQNLAVAHDNYNGAKIDFNWDDLNPGDGGEIRILTRGTAPNREFVIDFGEVPEYDGLHVATVQAILHEGSNDIVMNFIDVGDDQPTRNGVSIGIQGSDTEYLQYGYWGGRSTLESFNPLSTYIEIPDPEVRSDRDGDGLVASGWYDYVNSGDYYVGSRPSVGAPANGESLLFRIPEPASLVLLAVAGLGLIGFRKRRRG